MLDIVHDTDNLHPGILFRRAEESDTFADRIAIRPIPPVERLVNDDDRGRAAVVIRSKSAPRFQPHAERSEVIWRAGAEPAAVLLPWRRLRSALDQKAAGRVAPRQWNVIDEADRFDPRQRSDAPIQFSPKRPRLSQVVVLRRGQSETHRQYVRRIEAGIRVQKPPEVLHQQPGADQ